MDRSISSIQTGRIQILHVITLVAAPEEKLQPGQAEAPEEVLQPTEAAAGVGDGLSILVLGMRAVISFTRLVLPGDWSKRRIWTGGGNRVVSRLPMSP